MIFFALLVFLALPNGRIWAKVVDDFNECRQFFYMGTEPQGMDQNYKKICQKYGEHGGFYYASLYSKLHRIPVYSAYIFDPSCKNEGGQKSGDWFIEPMLSDIQEDEMRSYNSSERDQLRAEQAINDDYSNTGYDRGHLNPSSFQCRDGRRATFTLTNTAPVDACFNRVHWKQFEVAVKAILKPDDSEDAVRATLKPDDSEDAVRATLKPDDSEDAVKATSKPDDSEESVRATLKPDDSEDAVKATLKPDDSEDSVRATLKPDDSEDAVNATLELNDSLSFEDKDIFKNEDEPEVAYLKLKGVDEPKLNGTAYLVTGTVPSQNYRIPIQGQYDNPLIREFDRVTVPTHIWTAFCYKHSDDERSFSFGYIGLNRLDSRINVMTIPQLNNELSALYGRPINIFKDDCFSTKLKSVENIKRLNRKIVLPFGDKLVVSDDVQSVFHAALSPPSKKRKVTDVTILDSYDSLSLWFESNENMKLMSGTTCVLSKPHSNIKVHTGEVFCTIVPENLSGCTGSCLYSKEYRGYYCYYGTSKIPCSPHYSSVTVSGTRCRYGHSCGKHGKKYYWCQVDDSWDYCSPPLPLGNGRNGKPCREDHNCGFYDRSYTWCYTDFSGNWQHCCSINDRLSAQNGKTCKQNHLCGYHGKSYLWCHTTDGSWDYCCTP